MPPPAVLLVATAARCRRRHAAHAATVRMATWSRASDVSVLRVRVWVRRAIGFKSINILLFLWIANFFINLVSSMTANKNQARDDDDFQARAQSPRFEAERA